MKTEIMQGIFTDSVLSLKSIQSNPDYIRANDNTKFKTTCQVQILVDVVASDFSEDRVYTVAPLSYFLVKLLEMTKDFSGILTYDMSSKRFPFYQHTPNFLLAEIRQNLECSQNICRMMWDFLIENSYIKEAGVIAYVENYNRHDTTRKTLNAFIINPSKLNLNISCIQGYMKNISKIMIDKITRDHRDTELNQQTSQVVSAVRGAHEMQDWREQMEESKK